ncbi:exopolysaccharide biosynthesis protein [Litorivivens sp.]|uniref:exopolysaccharide biosynthesis protein n=2 Tax=Litorivivens sp. TaxID=2020868 RepID=UPI00356311BC
MENTEQPANLEQMLDLLAEGVEDDDKVSVRTMLQAAGSRSFAPALLLAGLIMFSPLSGIPGLPTVAALLVMLIAGQMLIGRNYFWLPDFIEGRVVPRKKFDLMLHWMYPVARFIDRFLKPRFTLLTGNAGTMLLTLTCMLIAISVPPLEIVPFLSSAAGALLVLLSLSMIANDGLVAMVAILLFAGMLWGGGAQLT